MTLQFLRKMLKYDNLEYFATEPSTKLHDPLHIGNEVITVPILLTTS